MAVGGRDRDWRPGGRAFERRIGVMGEPLEEREVGQGREQAAGHDDLLPPDLIRQPAEEDEKRRADEERKRDQQVRGLERHLEGDDQEEQGIELARVPDHSLAGGRADEREEDDLRVAPVGEALGERRLGRLALALDLLEHRRLLQPQPDIDGEDQQEQRDEERDAPAPCGELLWGQACPAHVNHCQGHEEPQGGSRLDPARSIAAPVFRGVLGDIRRRPAVLTSQRQPLHETQQHQQNGGDPTDRREGGQQPHRERRCAHTDDRHEKRILPADNVADAPEYQRAEGPHQKASRVRDERRQQRRRRVASREEQRCEKRGERRVQIEVIPLEHRA